MAVSALKRLWGDELGPLQPRLLLVQLLVAPFPPYTGGRMRALALRLAGFSIGQGTLFWGLPAICGEGDLRPRLCVGSHVWINVGGFWDLGAMVTIGDRVAIGQQVMILTGTHQVGGAERRAGPFVARPVRIGVGAWLGARCTLLPGVTVGEGAIVAAGAVVTCDVPPHTLVAGVPARVIRALDPGLGEGLPGEAC